MDSTQYVLSDFDCKAIALAGIDVLNKIRRLEDCKLYVRA